jgi:hypothetical protein
MGTAFQVDATSTNPALQAAANQIATMLEAELPAHDARLTPVKAQPETIISVSLVQVESARANETREEMVPKQTGTKNGKAVYSLAKENRMYVVVTGRVNATYQVRDATGAVLDSGTAVPAYKRDFLNGVGVPPPDAIQLDLLRLVSDEVVKRIAPTVEPVKVLMARPNDEIDDLNKLGEKNLWSMMLEKLELVKPLADKKKDAYRTFNLGVVNEALAYAASDIATSKRLLEQASSYYSKAIEANDDEKYFTDPQTRIAEAINGYTTLEAQMAKYEEMKASRDAAAAAAQARNANSRALGKPSAAEATGATYTNASVIKLVADGLDEANTIDFIKGAESVAFDFTPTGVQALLAGKVTNKVIAAMKARQTAKPAATRATGARPGGQPKPAADAVPKPPAPKAPAAPAKPSAVPAKPAAK